MLKVISGQNLENYNGIKFPEAGKHPNDIFINAKILVWASKFFNITIITYSPILIESIEVWSEYLEIEVEFYLNDKQIPQNKLYYIYSNLGEAYDKINILRLRTEYRKEGGKCCCL